ncbi:MAG: hypothetical protein JSS07_04675 [Proteobacteria bacterium]|nr:hypothetical protein [Pseudomonadota bacterium]
MRALSQQEIVLVSGANDNNIVKDEDGYSQIDDFILFTALVAVSSGFAAYMLTAVYCQSIPILIGITAGAALLGAGICLGMEMGLP